MKLRSWKLLGLMEKRHPKTERQGCTVLDLLGDPLTVLWEGLRTPPHQDIRGVLWCSEGAAAPLKDSGEAGLCMADMKWGKEKWVEQLVSLSLESINKNNFKKERGEEILG